jgi:hypothetical protein
MLGVLRMHCVGLICQSPVCGLCSGLGNIKMPTTCGRQQVGNNYSIQIFVLRLYLHFVILGSMQYSQQAWTGLPFRRTTGSRSRIRFWPLREKPVNPGHTTHLLVDWLRGEGFHTMTPR